MPVLQFKGKTAIECYHHTVSHHTLEFDVKLSSDGHPVVIHDQTVDRTTDGHGKVNELTLAQLKALDACKPFALAPVPPDLPFTLSVGFGDVRPRSVLVVPLCSRGEEVAPADKLMYCQKPLQPTELKQLAQALTTKWAAEWNLHTARTRLHGCVRHL